MRDCSDEFRVVNGGDVPIEVNTKRMTSSRFVDQSRLGSHEEWKQSDDPKKPGKIVRSPNSIEENVKRSFGALKFRSSYRNEGDGEQGSCCGPMGGKE